MPLSCSCDWDIDPEPGDWEYWYAEDDFEKLNTGKRKRCKSCNKLIDIGSFCIRFPRFRYPHNEIESRIFGVDWEYFEEPNIQIADHFICEKCGEIYLNLDSVGFECLLPTDNMPEMLNEYILTYNPQKLNNSIQVCTKNALNFK